LKKKYLGGQIWYRSLVPSKKTASKPHLIDDVRYTPESAELWRELGLDIGDEHVTETDIPTPNANAPMSTVKLWNNYDKKGSDGHTRYTVHYGFFKNNKLSNSNQEDIKRNLKALQEQTCLDFKEVSDEEKYAADGVIRFIKDSGCYSGLGRTSSSRISIGSGCTRDGTIQHEVMHSLGFHHEQVRPDRDDYVVVHSKNIQSGMERNFNRIKDAVFKDGPTFVPQIWEYGNFSVSKLIFTL